MPPLLPDEATKAQETFRLGDRFYVEEHGLVLGELFTNLKLFPFMYRGRVSDANLAVDNGWYEIFGDISNAPFTQSWGPLFVIGNSYKVQFAFYSVSDGFKLYVRQLNHTNFGWAKIDLTQV